MIFWYVHLCTQIRTFNTGDEHMSIDTDTYTEESITKVNSYSQPDEACWASGQL